MSINSLLKLANAFEKLANIVHLSNETKQKMKALATGMQRIVSATGPDAKKFFDDRVSAILNHWPLKRGEPMPLNTIEALKVLQQHLSMFADKGFMTGALWVQMKIVLSEYLTQYNGRYLQRPIILALNFAMKDLENSLLKDIGQGL